MNDPWLARWEPRPDARVRLVCFPYAGVGASVYRAWQALLPRDVDLVAVQLPGRETRLRETPLRQISAAADALLFPLQALQDMPLAFFGHSMGAVLAWSVTQALAGARRPLPVHLILSGRRAPGIPDRDTPLRHLPDEQFVTEINRRYGSIPPQVAADRDIMALLLPGLRADIEALETYDSGAGKPLDVPLTVLGGMTDERAGPADLEAWRAHTTNEFRTKTFPGGHFYLNSVRAAVVSEVASLLAPLLTPSLVAAPLRREDGP